jgi:transposase-like protein
MGKVYHEEVKKKAVQLDRLDPETTYAEVGRDLGISGETIRNWVLCRYRHKTHYADFGVMPT